MYVNYVVFLFSAFTDGNFAKLFSGDMLMFLFNIIASSTRLAIRVNNLYDFLDCVTMQVSDVK